MGKKGGRRRRRKEDHEDSVREKEKGFTVVKRFKRDASGTHMNIFRAMFRAQTTGKKVEHMKRGSARLKVTEKKKMAGKGSRGLQINCSISAEDVGV